MAKKKNVKTKANKLRLANAVQILKGFTTGLNSDDVISFTDLYQVNNSSSPITFTLQFNNIGVGATTDAVLHDVHSGDVIKADKARDSLINIPVDTNKNVDGKFLNIKSEVTATSLTPVPDDLKVAFSISGGTENKNFILPDAKFESSGNSIFIDISIFFFHI
ncbi:MAG: hypothetical protein ABIN24_04535 [Dyadobacter sp.]